MSSVVRVLIADDHPVVRSADIVRAIDAGAIGFGRQIIRLDDA